MTAASDLAVLAAHGMLLFPVHDIRKGQCSCGDPKCSSPGKHPRVRDWQDLAINDMAAWRAWWREFNGCNYGIACGQSGIFVLDSDPDKGGETSIAQLERQHGTLPETWQFLTGGGGRHILFRDPGIELDLRNSASKLGPGLDTRGHGGFIVAPQSRHISGRVYAIDVDHHPDEFALADIPPWLLTLLTQVNSHNGYKAPVPTEEWRALVGTEIGEGRRNEAITRLTGYLLRHWLDPYVALELVQSFNRTHCAPPLDSAEVEATVASIARRECDRRSSLQTGR